VRRSVHETDSVRTHADALSMRTDTRSVENDVGTAVSIRESVRTLRNETESSNLPASVERWRAGVANGSRSHADALTVRADVHSVHNESKTPIDALESVRTPRKEPKIPNSPG